MGLGGGLNVYGFAAGDPVSYSDPFGLCPGLNNSASLFDCPPGYFELLGAIAGGLGGFLGGGGAGVLAAAPTGEAAAPVTVPVGAIGGLIEGAKVGAAAGAIVDGVVQMAQAGKGRGGNRKPNEDADRIVNESNLNKAGRPALHDKITGKGYDLDEIRRIAQELAEQSKYRNDPPPTR